MKTFTCNDLEKFRGLNRTRTETRNQISDLESTIIRAQAEIRRLETILDDVDAKLMSMSKLLQNQS